MCTVVIRVPDADGGPVRVLAVRDEDPARPWRPLGHWWPDYPGVRGVQDELAGGAWLAVDGGRMAVLVNKSGGADVAQPTSRGHLVLDAVLGRPLPDPLTTLGFNLVVAEPGRATVTSWQGGQPTRLELSPGTHMISHGEVDDPEYERIRAWLPRFSAADTNGEPWWADWLDVLAESAQWGPKDPRAIIRDNRPDYPTLSLLVVAISVDQDGAQAAMDTLDEPGVWNRLRLR